MEQIPAENLLTIDARRALATANRRNRAELKMFFSLCQEKITKACESGEYKVCISLHGVHVSPAEEQTVVNVLNKKGFKATLNRRQACLNISWKKE